jgi:hypothetical protein
MTQVPDNGEQGGGIESYLDKSGFVILNSLDEQAQARLEALAGKLEMTPAAVVDAVVAQIDQATKDKINGQLLVEIVAKVAPIVAGFLA